MKAVRFIGTPAAAVREVPQPAAEGPHDVIVRVAGAGVCRTDLHILEGVSPLRPAPPPPFTLGHENVGWVEEMGADVRGWARGDAVILHPAISCGHCSACRAGTEMFCLSGRLPGVDGSDGGYAEFVRTSDRALVRLDGSSDLVPLAPLADAGLTAYHAVKRILPRVHPGAVVVVIGVGGLGHIGIQLLKAMAPVRIVAVDVAEGPLELARQLGAETALSATDPNLVADVLRASASEGADVVMDFVAERETPDLAVRMLRRGGTYSIVGYGGSLSIPTVEMVVRELTVLGNFVGTYRDLVELMELHRRGRVQVSVHRYPLDRAPAALDDLRHGRVAGRAVLIP
ncbi:MAG TPA: NAD(P)-dependent alcohol dehydrogenase [Thermoplasmata archaeon]